MNFDTEDVLLTPMHVDALPVGEQGQNKLFQWTDLAPDFSLLTDGRPPLGDALFSAGDPFRSGATLDPGVHLHFRLPDGLRHGRVEAGRTPVFPPLPNRWQVIRLVESECGVVSSCRRFLIKSDETDQPDLNGCLWPVHEAENGRMVAGLATQVGGITRTVKMGDASLLDGDGLLPEDDVAAVPVITAIGPGDPTVLSNYRASGRMFGMHDHEIAEEQECVVTYLVTGWYSSVQDDPLFDVVAATLWAQGILPQPDGMDGVDGPFGSRHDWSKLTPVNRHAVRAALAASRAGHDDTDPIDEHREMIKANIAQWLADQRLPPMKPSAGETNPLPCRLVCHGLVRRIRWRGSKVDHSVPEEDQQHAEQPIFPILGPETPDHRVALGESLTDAMAAQISPDPTLRKLLGALGEGLLDQRLTTGHLSAELHARHFENAASETVFTAQSTPTPDTRPDAPAPPPPKDLKDEIAALNADQAGLDTALRAHTDLRAALHDLYSRAFMANAKKGKEPTDLAEDPDFAADFKRLRNNLDDLEATMRKALENRDGRLKNGDPKRPAGGLEAALKAAGPTFSVTRSTRRPFHRFADPVLTVSGTSAQRHQCAPSNAPPEDPAFCRLRAEIRSDLEVTTEIGAINTIQATETLDRTVNGAVMVDALHRALLAEAILSDPDPKRVEWLAGLTETDKQTIEAWQKLAGGLDAFAFTWQGPPWIPLFAAWEARWTASWETADDERLVPHKITKGWYLDHEGDFAPRDPAPDTGASVDFSGFAPLLLDGFDSFAQKIKTVLDDQDAPDAGWALINTLKDRLVAQVSLSGLAEALTRRRKTTALPLFDYAEWFEGTLKTVSEPTGQIRTIPGDAASPYLPIRDGTLTLTQLSIIDMFGQTRRLVAPDLTAAEVAPDFRLGNGILALPNTTPFSGRMPPRLVQPGRIRAELDHGDGPIAGWVVLNWLEQSILLHRADGVPIVVLQRRLGNATAGQTGFLFQPVPEALEAPGTDGFGDADLAGFADWARNLSANDAEEFLRALGRAVERADQRIPDQNDAAAELVGRPFALVRVDLSLELSGLPAFRPGRDDGADGDDDGFGDVEWPVQLGADALGNDGLAGLFDGAPSSDAQFLLTAGSDAPIEGTDRFDRQTLTIKTATPRRLTLLMDPQARVHVTTGVIPRSYFELPPDLASGAKQARDSYFLTAPVLGFETGGAPSLPVPSDDFGEWSWVWRPEIRCSASEPNLVHAAERGGFTGTRPTITEGWLKLSRNDLGRVSIWMREPGYLVAPGTRITLEWSAQGAEDCVLECCAADSENWQEISPENTQIATGVLIGSVHFKIEKTTAFRLTARAGQDEVVRDLTIETVQIKGAAADD